MNGVDRLNANVNSFITHVKSLPPNPTTEQLQNKVSSLCNTIKNDSRTVPPQVKSIVKSGFDVMGWDVIQMRLTNPALLTIENLLKGLEQMKNQLGGWTPSVVPTTEELASLSKACQRLWDMDVHRLVPEKDYAIDLQVSSGYIPS